MQKKASQAWGDNRMLGRKIVLRSTHFFRTSEASPNLALKTTEINTKYFVFPSFKSVIFVSSGLIKCGPRTS